MDKAKKRKLFKVFENIRQQKRHDSVSVQSAQGATSGCGLGLYLSKKLVDYLEGDIIIQSELRIGTQVKVFLPVSTHKEDGDDSILVRVARSHSQEIMLGDFKKKKDKVSFKKLYIDYRKSINRIQESGNTRDKEKSTSVIVGMNE